MPLILKEVNPELDCVMIEYPFVDKIHNEILALGCDVGNSIHVLAEKYGAEAFLADGSDYYLFRFKTPQDKLAFILKNS